MKSTISDLEAEIAEMRAAVGAKSDSQLAEIIGLTRGAVTQWRNRGKVPDKARRSVEAFKEGGQRQLKMDAYRRHLGDQVLYEGRCLALYLAPSFDATFTRRFSLSAYGGILRTYASLFDEIALACADEIADRLSQITGNAADAFDSLLKDDPKDLYERVLKRAHQWRAGLIDEHRVG